MVAVASTGGIAVPVAGGKEPLVEAQSMAHWPEIPLEDSFGDVLRKAMRGADIDVPALSAACGIARADLDAWIGDKGRATGDQARAIARVLRLDPEKLAVRAADAWRPPPIDRPDVRHHPQDPHPSNGYVFFLDDGKRSALVDPAGVPANLLRILRDGAYHLQYILITHKHADHCDATAEIAAAFPAAQIVMHALDAHAIGTLGARAIHVKDGEELPFGDDAAIRMLHTPGHTDGSSSYLFKSALFTGDTIFAGSVGGAYGDVTGYVDILNGIRSKIFTLPDDTVLMPGHGPPTTVALEKAHNPFF
ncbi:MAG TPA: MBL fold metallo-hydrolase [Candidatus Aquilonibacter sp.]|nr:MBL fold metallo-hydrolase [Candidatus Aquilonibacter sp.]